MFRKALSIANKNLMCYFDEKLYHQVRGLAMGLTSSLKLANIYGCFLKIEQVFTYILIYISMKNISMAVSVLSIL